MTRIQSSGSSWTARQIDLPQSSQPVLLWVSTLAFYHSRPGTATQVAVLRVLVIHGRAKIALPAGEGAPQRIAAVLLATHLDARNVSRGSSFTRAPGMIVTV